VSNDAGAPDDWRTDPDVCGSCIAWLAPSPVEIGKDGAPVGSCRLRPELRRVPATLGKCALYRGRGQPRASGESGKRPARSGSTRRTGPAIPPSPPPPALPERWTTAQAELHRAARAALGGSALLPMTSRFEGGTTEVIDREGRVISMPNERVFAHLCRLKRALDQLEARLPDEELKSQVARARGSLTSFNFLFGDPTHVFSGKR